MKPSVFIGAERVGKAVLENLLSAGKNITAVFTAHPGLKCKIADYVNFKELEKKFPQVDFHYIVKTNASHTIDKIKSYKPETIFIISWSQIIPPDVIKIPPKGVVGLHYSLLPRRRGGAPLNWAIIDGLKESGITLFYMERGIDAGPIIAQRKLSIDHEDTVNDLLSKIEKIAPSMVLQYFDKIIEGNIHAVKQEESEATYTRARKPEDGEIDPTWDLERIYNFIRALAPPYPSAFLKLHSKKITFTSAKMEKDEGLKVEGHITENNDKK